MNTNVHITSNKTKIKKVFSKRLARELRFKGLCIVGVEPNKYKPEFNVYLFEDTPELQRAFSEVMLGK